VRIGSSQEFRAAVTGYSDDPDIRRLRRRTENWKLRLRALLGDTGGFGTRKGAKRAFNQSTMGLLHYQQVSLSSRGLARLID